MSCDNNNGNNNLNNNNNDKVNKKEKGKIKDTLYIVSRHIPFKVIRTRSGKVELKADGTGLHHYKREAVRKRFRRIVWVALVLAEDYEKLQPELERVSSEEEAYMAVGVDQETLYSAYCGFYRETIWKLLHYLPPEKFEMDQWEAFCQVNKLVATLLVKVAKSTDWIWLHEIFFAMAAMYIRQQWQVEANESGSPNCPIKIALVIQVPFPSSETIRSLPMRKEFLLGILHNDLVCFQS